mgnify:FL=1|jgi:hypothetical protein
MKRRYIFECEIEVSDQDDIQWSHLPEEIQMYLDSNYEHNNTSQVIRWNVSPEQLVSHTHVRKDMDIL